MVLKTSQSRYCHLVLRRCGPCGAPLTQGDMLAWQLTRGAHEGQAAEIRRVVGSVHAGHIAAHGGAYQVERFFVQLEAFHKLE